MHGSTHTSNILGHGLPWHKALWAASKSMEGPDQDLQDILASMPAEI
jgi:hypothetical protein